MYTSKYYSCEQIDERLLQGTYDDAVKAGFVGTKVEFDAIIAKVATRDNPGYMSKEHVINIEKNTQDNQVNLEKLGNQEKIIDEHTKLIQQSKTDIIKGDAVLQDQIDAIVANNARLIVSVNKNPIFEDTQTKVTISARLSGATGKITLGGKVSGENVSEFTIVETINKTTKYIATAVVKGKIINSNEIIVTATKPYFVGPGNVYTDVYSETYKHGPSFSAKGNYQFDVKQNEKIYIIVPNNFSVKSVTFVEGGFGLPVEISSTETLEGYHIYVSGERKEGNYNIKIE